MSIENEVAEQLSELDIYIEHKDQRAAVYVGAKDPCMPAHYFDLIDIAKKSLLKDPYDSDVLEIIKRDLIKCVEICEQAINEAA